MFVLIAELLPERVRHQAIQLGRITDIRFGQVADRTGDGYKCRQHGKLSQCPMGLFLTRPVRYSLVADVTRTVPVAR